MFYLITAIAISHGIDPNLFHAILWAESSQKHASISRTGDLGIAQISPHLARGYGWDVKRLKTDLRYNLVCAATYLKDLKAKYEKKEPKIWFTRYHSRNMLLRFRYMMRVSKFREGR